MGNKRVLIFLGLGLLPVFSKAITLDNISNFLLNSDLPQLTPYDMIANQNFFGKLDTTLETDDELVLSAYKKPNSLEMTYMKLDGEWLLNDVSFSYYSNNDVNCDKQQNAYIKHLTKKLNKATFNESDEGMFWQLQDRSWGIWLSIDRVVNPFSNASGCSSKIILIYSNLNEQHEDEDF
ncbi:hypothetical protein [Wohlfahrtiimonas larvae]|uniref:Uncharacterized protein n=1 Tax=Wohlfahrtiimonas larvae TaxID=1157986 RepID=A0ABP9MRN3_9GAMM|nr:hypothetical protein [Wohlfahrtiimonas larvae]